ncbi:MAG TPA: ATP-binding protein [Gammaproteobacteria bacterium]|nr:ATP-binding protein [Gammaproteobacteria bacterium]
MTQNKPTLHFISGKLGSGKTTLAKKISQENNAIFISEDSWLDTLFPRMIHGFEDYLHYSKIFRTIIAIHVAQLLAKGTSVVFDFAGNIPQERQWVKSLIEKAGAFHVLHYVVASDDLCRRQYKQRNLDLPEGSKRVTDEEFNAINQYFMPPENSEGFNVQLHYRE